MFRTRFAPSPTGFLHLGSIRTALFAWLLARHYGGTCALRIEDTDKTRSTQEYVGLIFEGLEWLGLSFDGPVVYQSQRDLRYKEVVRQLLDKNKAYYCTCSQERLAALREHQQQTGVAHWHYDGHCRGQTQRPNEPAVVRLATPSVGIIKAIDKIQGTIELPWEVLDDWIIQRSDGSVVYNFAVVVDDYDQQITHVVRGADHVSNTPKQVALYELLGWSVPEFCHIPLILDNDGAKLSKRNKSANMLQYRDLGFLPEALMNAIARLGWSHGDQEIFNLSELVEHFSFEKLNKSPSMFNEEKFHWIARQHFGVLNLENFAKRGAAFFSGASEKELEGYAVLSIGRAENFSQAVTQTLFVKNAPEVSWESLIEKYPHLTKEFLKDFARTVTGLKSSESFFDAIKSVCKAQKLAVKDLALPVRVLLTGTEQSPDLKNIVTILGLSEVIRRLEAPLKVSKWA